MLSDMCLYGVGYFTNAYALSKIDGSASLYWFIVNFDLSFIQIFSSNYAYVPICIKLRDSEASVYMYQL